MRRTAFIFLLLTAGCIGVDRPSEEKKPVPASGVPSPSRPAPPEKPLEKTEAMPSAPKVVVVPAPAPPAKAPVVAAAAAPKAAAATAAAAAPKAAAAPAAAKADTAAHLDLTSLEKRLRDTKAIGTFTKLALKNEVDDLLEKFRNFYQGKLRTTLNELRPAYETLMMKVLSLLQNDDPTLAGEIARSREAIWGILADRNKFATI